MLPIYLVALGLGGVLILANLATGGHGGDSDVDHDLGGDHDAGEIDHDVDDADHEAGEHADQGARGASASGWMPLLSLRFWTFALAAFGLNGTALTALSADRIVTGLASVVVGLGVGLGASTLFHRLQRDQVSGPTTLQGLEGAEALVLLPLSEGDQGKVRVEVGGQDVDLPARTLDPGRIERGTRAMVVEVKDGVAVVTPVRRRAPAREV